MKKFYYILAAIAVIGMLFVGCPNETNGQNDSNSSEKNGDNSTSDDSTFGLLIQLHGMSRAVTYYTEDDVAYYSIALSLNNQFVSNVQGQPGEIVKVSLQTEGTYTITVSAYNAAGTLIGGGFGQKAISTNDGFISVTIEITPSVKSITADLSIDIIWQHLTDPSADSLKPSYLVVFYANGGSGTMERMLCEIGKEYTLPECNFTAPAGMKFNGWTIGASGEKFTDLSETNHDVVVVGAEWTKIYEYNIIYHNLQGGNTDSPTTYDVRNNVRLRAATRKNWYFAGWYDNAEYVGNKIFGWSADDHTNDVELWAKWGDTLPTYSISGNISDISNRWGGSSLSPSFSISLLDEVGIEYLTSDPNSSPQDLPVGVSAYILTNYGNLTFTTQESGVWGIYGIDKLQYYDGCAVEIKSDGTYTLYVDMEQINRVQLRGMGQDYNREGPITAEDVVILSDYKPYAIALTNSATPVCQIWDYDLVGICDYATFPMNIQKPEIPVPTLADIDTVCGSFNEWNKSATNLSDGADQYTKTYTFTMTSSMSNDGILYFNFCIANASYYTVGASSYEQMTSGTEYEARKNGDSFKIPYQEGVTVTITYRYDPETEKAYVKYETQ